MRYTQKFAILISLDYFNFILALIQIFDVFCTSCTVVLHVLQPYLLRTHFFFYNPSEDPESRVADPDPDTDFKKDRIRIRYEHPVNKLL